MEKTNEKMIAYCGITCTDCHGYIATKTNDHELAEKTAKLWSEQFNIDVKVTDVWCDGCLVGGKKCSHCSECEIRACAEKEEVENCAHCVDYPCSTLKQFFAMAPDTQKTLDAVKAGL
jgi:hypothetical protein